MISRLFVTIATTRALPTLILVSCSGVNNRAELHTGHVIKAVDVGNPEDTSPGKKVPQQPSRTLIETPVSFEITADNLEEIDSIEFQLKQAQIWITNHSGAVTVAKATPENNESESLIIQSRSMRRFSAVLTNLVMNDAKSVQMVLTFSQSNPGHVIVGAERFAIEPQIEPLFLPIQQSQIPPFVATDVSVKTVPVEVTKSSLFSTEKQQTPVAGAGSEPSKPRMYTLKKQ